MDRKDQVSGHIELSLSQADGNMARRVGVKLKTKENWHLFFNPFVGAI